LIGYAQDSIVNQRVVGVRVEEWTKAIPEGRDRWQSAVLVWVVGGLLVLECLPIPFLLIMRQNGRSAHLAFLAGLVSLTFGVVVWALRAATPMAAFFGATICFQITVWTARTDRPLYESGLAPLMALFGLTFLAGRVGREKTRSERRHLDQTPQDGALASAAGVPRMTDSREERMGRRASQVAANLGAAALVSIMRVSHPVNANKMLVLGALAEATADTVSSEIGAAFGGRPFLITTFRRVDAGTDGAVSLLGTLAGAVAAGVVVAMGGWSMGLTVREGVAAFVGGLVGLLFDSLLGATVERRGWVGNDWVNFLSTVMGGVVAWGMAIV
jgi:hypothetical protein